MVPDRLCFRGAVPEPPPDRVVLWQGGGRNRLRACGGRPGGHARAVARILIGVILHLAAITAAAGATGQFLTTIWQTSEGMPHNSATAVLQDRRGYLWVATTFGLARFDGVRFECFRVADGLPDSRVLSLMEDRQGRIWAGTASGVAVREEGAWQVKEAPWPTAQVWSVTQAGDGAIWLGDDNHFFRCHGDRVDRIDLDDSGVRFLLPDGAEGAMWILYRHRLFRWEAGTAVADEDFERVSAGRELWGIAREDNGALWASGAGLLARRDPGSRFWRDVTAGMPDGDGAHIRLLTARDGSLWVATRNRGLRFLRDGKWRVIGVDDGLSHEDVRDIREDREGNLWASTNGGGLNRMNEQQIEVFGRGRGLGRHVTTALASDPQGTLWAGTDGGGVMKLVDRKFEPALPEGVLNSGYVWSLTTGADGSLWVGTFRDGVLRWRDGQAEWLRKGDGLLHNWVPSLMVAADGMLWIGTRFGGVQTWDGHSLRTLSGSPAESGAAITGFLQTADGDVWAASAGNGLMRWHAGVMRRFTTDDGLPTDVVSALHQADSGTLWLGTGGGGLAAWRVESEDFVSWSAADGLLNDSVQQVQSDLEGHLWLGTDDGLQRIDPADLLSGSIGARPFGRGQVFSRSDGLPTPQFSGGHGNLSLREPDGSLWFSLAAGAVRVPIDASARSTDPALVHIEALWAGDREVWHFEKPSDGPSELAPGERDVEIRFTAPRLGAPESVRFRYRLIGIDADWRVAGTERLAAYPSLPPGDYRFEVVAAGRDGQWPERVAALEFHLRPWLWETAVIRSLAVLAGVILLAAIVRFLSLRRMRRKMRLLEQEQRIEKERSRIARDLHDDLGTTLTEINFLGSLGIAGAQTTATRGRLEGIVERAQRMTKSLDEIVWTVNPANDTLASTVSYLCSRTRESLAAAGIRCRLEIADEFPTLELDSERRHHLLMIVNEAVNNIMKHSAANVAKLRIMFARDVLEVTIEDDGTGFDPAEVKPDRNGLKNILRRIRAAGGQCTIDSAPGSGTRVMLTLEFSESRTSHRLNQPQ